MSLIQSIILGIIQGLTEFLPISSSAHLVLIPHLLNWSIPESQVFPFDVLVQLGTLVAVIVYFWTDLWTIVKAFFKGLIDRKPFENENARLGWYLILATIPASILGLLIKDKVEAVFNDANATAIFLYFTAALLILTELVGKRTRNLKEITWFDALWIGIFQALSLFPGVSRSGSTIAGGMFRKFDRPSAARFSFLMSIPVMLGASVVSISDVIDMPDPAGFLPIILAGFVAALLVGYLSIHWLLGYINKHSFYTFAIYCILFGSIVLVTDAIREKNQSVSVLPEKTPIVQTLTLEGTKQVESISNNNPLSVGYSSSTAWLLPAMSTCAGALNDFSIVTHLLPTEELNNGTDNLFFYWGSPEELNSYAAVIGHERLAIISNPQNPLVSLPLELIQGLSSAEYDSWGYVYQKCPECFSTSPDESLLSSAPILNFYSSSDETQTLFTNSVMLGKPVSKTSALLIPGSQQMVETVAENPAAIGFIPAHQISDQVKEVSLQNIDPSKLQKPILAVTESEPKGTTRDWLLCIQKAINP